MRKHSDPAVAPRSTLRRLRSTVTCGLQERFPTPNAVNVGVGLQLPLPKLLAHLRDQDLRLLGRPSKPRHGAGGDGLHALDPVGLVPLADLAGARILAPGAHGDEKLLLGDGLEAGVLEPRLVVARVGPRPPGLDAGLDDQPLPPRERAVGRRLRVREHQREARVLELEDAARRQRGEGRPDDVREVLEARHGGARVDVREFAREQPLVFGVVDHEAAVWWHVQRLDW